MKLFHSPNRSKPTLIGTFSLKRVHYTERVRHTHRGIELSYVTSGEAQQTIWPADGSEPFTVRVTQGCYYFTSYGTYHDYRNGSENFAVINLMVNPEMLDVRLSENSTAVEIEKILLNGMNFPGHIPFDCVCRDYENQMEYLFERILMLQDRKLFGMDAIYRAYAEEILITALNQSILAESRPKVNIAEIVKEYVDIYYPEQIALTDIAQRFHYAPNYVRRKFKEKYGLSFEQYLQQIRMEQARRLLTKSELSIDRIAGLVSYSASAPFRRIFKKHFGITPTEYRAQHQNPPQK